EVTQFAEIEELLIEVCPVRHATTIDVVCQVVDELKTRANRLMVYPFNELEIDVIDGRPFFEAVDEIERCSANSFDGGQAQLHETRMQLHGLCTQVDCASISFLRVLYAKGEAAHRWPMLSGKISSRAFRLAVDDGIDIALAVQSHLLRTVVGHLGEAHAFEHGFDDVGCGRGEFNELEHHETHGILEKIYHFRLLCCER